MDGRHQGVRRRRQDRAGVHGLTFRVVPLLLGLLIDDIRHGFEQRHPEVWRRVAVLAGAVGLLLGELDDQQVERLWQQRLAHARKPADEEGERLLALLAQDETP